MLTAVKSRRLGSHVIWLGMRLRLCRHDTLLKGRATEIARFSQGVVKEGRDECRFQVISCRRSTTDASQNQNQQPWAASRDVVQAWLSLMAKTKAKSNTGLRNRHLHARISYLHQAAKYLASQNSHHGTKRPNQSKSELTGTASDSLLPGDGGPQRDRPKKPRVSRDLPSKAPRYGDFTLPESPSAHLLNSHLVQVARKSQIRLHSSLKHSFCKRCNGPLIEGTTCHKFMENLSKGGKKPQADVLVLICQVCNASKRWPVGAKRQCKKGQREASSETLTQR